MRQLIPVAADFLRSTVAVGGVGAAFTAVPFIKSWNPSAKAKAAGAPVEVDISKLEPGQLIRVEWRGKPVWVVKRTKQTLDALAAHDDKLRDPASDEPQQPDYAHNGYRSIKPEIFVAVGICTHLGCSPPTCRTTSANRCRGDFRFLLPVPWLQVRHGWSSVRGACALELVIPPYQYLSDTTITVGADGKEA